MAQKKKITRKRIKSPLGDMTPDEFRHCIDKFGLNQEQAGIWLGMSPRQGQRYANGEVSIPPPVQMLFEIMLRYELTIKDVNPGFQP